MNAIVPTKLIYVNRGKETNEMQTKQSKTFDFSIQSLAMSSRRWGLWLEFCVLLLTIFAFWHHAPPIRDRWLWLLGLAVPAFALRFLIWRRLASWTPLLGFALGLLALSLLNYAAAPMQRESYWIVMSRPLLGIWLLVAFGEMARAAGRMDGLLLASAGLGLLLGLGALLSSDWTTKSALFAPLIENLPRLDTRSFLPDMLLRFNVNEIAGALAWLTPLMVGLALRPALEQERWRPLLRTISATAAALLLIALLLGQSRFAIGGVLIGLALLLWTQTRGRWRAGLMITLVLVGLLQAVILFNLLPSSGDAGLNERDENTISTRGEIWASSLKMLNDHPVTGIGMAMFRAAVRQPPYEIEYYVQQGRGGPPHAHNEWVQMAAEMGWPGLLAFIGMQASAGWMLWRAGRRGSPTVRHLAITLASAWIAHAVYSLGDAIPLWDRFAFLFWWLAGLSAALFLCATRIEPKLKVETP